MTLSYSLVAVVTIFVSRWDRTVSGSEHNKNNNRRAAACEDDVAWHGALSVTHTCSFVAIRPSARCNRVNGVDGRLAAEACLKTCDPACEEVVTSTMIPTPTPTIALAVTTMIPTATATTIATTSSPTNTPTATATTSAPTNEPVTNPPLSCVDDATWHSAASASQTCSWVSQRPFFRCATAMATSACVKTCSPKCVLADQLANAGTGAIFIPGDNNNDNNNTTSTTISSSSPTSSPIATDTIVTTPLTCENDDAWHGAQGASQSCAYVAMRPTLRCRLTKGDDGTTAMEACPLVCDARCVSRPTTSPAPTPAMVCADDPAWVSLLDYAHTCAWVADLPRLRCPTTPGFDGQLARAACVDTCHPACANRPTTSPAPTALLPCVDDPAWHGALNSNHDCGWMDGGLPGDARCGRPILSWDLRDPQEGCPLTCAARCQDDVTLVGIIQEFNPLQDLALFVVGGLTEVVTGVFDVTAGAVGLVLDVTGAVLSTVVSVPVTVVGGAFDLTGAVVGGIADTVGDVFDTVFNVGD